ncbi:MAG: hypothetical protein AB7P03_07430 [Kofleriaceae bacterium]
MKKTGRRWMMLVFAACAAAWFAWGGSSATPTSTPQAGKRPGRVEDVLRDLAVYRDTIYWNISSTRSIEGTPVEFRTVQGKPAKVEVDPPFATIETTAWRVTVRPTMVDEAVCTRQFVEPDIVFLLVELRAAGNTLFHVEFPQAQEPAFRKLCERHGLRKIGDF